MLRLMTSADRRLAAISKVVRVRVLFSKNRLNTVLPRSSGTFLTSRSAIETNGTAVSRMRSMISAGKPSSVSRCCSSPGGVELRITHRLGSPAASTDSSSLPSAWRCSTIDRSCAQPRGVRRRRSPRSAVRGRRDRQHREFDRLGTPVVEQLVDRGAHRTAGVENVVDEHDAAAGDVEGQRGRFELRAQPFLRVIVAIKRDVDVADRVLAAQASAPGASASHAPPE